MKLPLEDVYTRLKMLSRRRTDFRLENNEVAMYDIFNINFDSFDTFTNMFGPGGVHLKNSAVGMYDIFNTLKKQKDSTVLVEGSPGIGKTTFCLKIAYDWANGKIPKGCSFPEFNIVLLLKCRDIDGDIIEAINEQLLPEDDDVKKELRDYIQDIHNQEQVLIILDGLDELPIAAEHHVDRLLQKRMFPFCSLLATSRQERGIELRQNVNFDVLLQMDGFTDKDAFQYIRKHFRLLGPEHLSKGERLIKAIQENSFLHALPNNPLNLLLLCVVFEDYEGELPSRRSELYQIIVRCILRRFCAKNKLEAPQDDEALEKKFEQSLQVLGELAWKCLLEDRLSFREGELAKFEKMHKDLAARISGFVFKEASLKKINPQHEYRFFHKTFVEYLAAAYLAFLLLKKEVNIFKEFQLDFHDHIVVKYRQVFLFLSGILGEEVSEDWDWPKCQEEEAEFFTESFSESGNAEQVAMALFSFIPFRLTVQVGGHDNYSYSSFFEVEKYCRNLSQLRHPVHLSMRWNLDYEADGDFEVNYSFDYLKSCLKLQSLFVSTLKALGNASCDGLSQNSTLVSVTLRTFQSLPCDRADIFGDSLAASNTLTSVTFELFNEWGEAWARALEKGLSADTPLRSVALKIYGSLSDTAILALKRVLLNTSLTSVVITIFGDMQDSLAATLWEGLSKQAVLKSFTLIVFGRLSESGIVFLKRGFLQNCSVDAFEVKIFGELPDNWATVIKGIISANKAKQSCTFHPNTSGNIAAAKVACLTAVLAKTGFNLEQTLNVWGDLSCEVIEAVGRLLVKFTPCRLTLNIYGNVTDDVASSLTSYLKIETCVHLVTFNIWGELTTNGKAAIERLSGANQNANLKVIVHDLISDCSPCGVDFCIDNPSLLPSVFTKVKDTGTSELSLTISGASDDWAQGLNDGLTNSTSLTTLALTIENCPGENVGWTQRLLEVVLENTSLATLALTLTSYSLTDKGIDLSNSLAKNVSLTALSLTINSHISGSCFLWLGLRDGLASNKSLRILTLTIKNHSDTGRDWILDLGRGLALNKSLHTLTLTINNNSGMARGLIQGLSDGLASNKSLHTLTLTINNQSGTAGGLIQGLGDGLASNKSLQTLTLTINNNSGTAGGLIQGLRDGLASNTSLHTLTLAINNNSGTAVGLIQGLGDGLASNKSLHTLTLSINNNSSTAGDLIQGLGDGLASNKSLQTLTLRINNNSHMAVGLIQGLGDGLASNKSLHTLTLAINNNSATAGDLIQGLGHGLASNKSLQTLTLTIDNYSGTGEDWIRDLGDGLASNESLRLLTLTINNYSDFVGFSIMYLSHGLAGNESLATLTLTINNYSGSGADWELGLADGLASNKSLTTLTLTINNYSDAAGVSITDIGDGLARNLSLTTISLAINSCSEVSEDQLRELCNNLARSDTLTTLNLTINKHSPTSRGLGCDLSKCFANCKSLTTLSLTVSLYGEKNVC